MLSALELGGTPRVIVTFDPSRPRHRLPLEGSEHLRVARRLQRAPMLAATVDRVGLDALRSLPAVRAIGLDRGGSGHLLESLPLSGFAPIEAAGLDGSGVVVAVLDTGVDTSHPDLEGKIVDEACFCSTNCCPGGQSEEHGAGSAMDDNGHGTHVAGEIISSGLNGSPRGGAPGASLIAIKVLDENTAFCCTSDIVAALDWLLANHPEVDIVNLSLGSTAVFEGHCDSADASTSALATVVDMLAAQRTVVVASSGNAGSATGMASPACIQSVVSTGAVWDEDIGPESIYCVEPMTAPDRIACFSNASTTTDVLAPGGRVTSTWLLDSARIRVGTSNAAPIVSACAASLRQVFPLAEPLDIAAALRSSPVRLLDSRNGMTYPRLDCGAALEALTSALSDAGSVLDSSVPDGATSDAGSTDAGLADTGPVDAASFDATTCDASESDSSCVTADAAELPDDSAMPDDAADPGDGAHTDRDSAVDGSAGRDGADANTEPGMPRLDASPDAAATARETGGCACGAIGAPRGTADGRFAGLVTTCLLIAIARVSRSRRRTRGGG